LAAITELDTNHGTRNVRRKYLSPDEARRLIEAAGNVGRQGERESCYLP
jgi:hypothetical protein